MTKKADRKIEELTLAETKAVAGGRSNGSGTMSDTARKSTGGK